MAGARAVLRTWVARTWLVLQTTVAGTTAWVVANQIGGHTTPVFAPVAAVVVLNAARGERAHYALRLLLGAAIGIASGELVELMLGGGYLSFAVATFSALAIVAAFARTQLTLNQAAGAAILTVALTGSEAGFERMRDALIGAGVAVVFTQAIFSPEPISLVRRAESMALARMAEGLTMAADALAGGGAVPTQPDLAQVRQIRDALTDVARARVNSRAVVRRVLTWRYRTALLAQVIENAGQLELLGASCLLLIRTAAFAESKQRQSLAAHIQTLARALKDLSADPTDRSARQAAVNRALKVASEFGDLGHLRTHVPEVIVQVSLLMVSYDIVVFAGVAPSRRRRRCARALTSCRWSACPGRSSSRSGPTA